MSILATAPALASNSQSISFKSADGILITADSYVPHTTTSPLILLFHQAGSSRGEYNEIAPRLNELGFNCIAVDLRSGEFSRGKITKPLFMPVMPAYLPAMQMHYPILSPH